MRQNKKWFLLLHLILGIYSLGSVFSKLASCHEFGSMMFFCLYAVMIVTLGIYAVGWQQVIKHLPLTTAYINKAVTVIWGAIFGMLFFQESFSWKRLLAILLIIAGVILYVLSDEVDSL